jgi:hypothetical protein
MGASKVNDSHGDAPERRRSRRVFVEPELVRYGDVRSVTRALGMGKRGDGLPGLPAKTG